MKKSRSEYNKEYREKNPNKIPELKLKAKYGITLKEYEEKLEKQDRRCAICGEPPLNERLCQDHCHDTKQNRGLLCKNCNLGLGHLDTEKKLLAAVEYLKVWSNSD